MGFSSMNAVKSAKGLQGTTRQSATFTGQAAGPAAAGMDPSAGMQGPLQSAHAVPQGSSYSTSGGMQNTSRTNAMNANAYNTMPDANGVIAGQQGRMADVGQVGPQLTAAEMQDPANAAMAGFQFAQGQDRPVQASAPVNAGQQVGQQQATLPAPAATAPPMANQSASLMSRGALLPAPAQAPKPPQYGRTM